MAVQFAYIIILVPVLLSKLPVWFMVRFITRCVGCGAAVLTGLYTGEGESLGSADGRALSAVEPGSK